MPMKGASSTVDRTQMCQSVPTNACRGTKNGNNAAAAGNLFF
jgi:hypothetical protein